MKKIAFVGSHGTGKSKVCNDVISELYKQGYGTVKVKYDYDKDLFIALENSELKNISFIPEQFREVVKDIPNFTKQTEEITLATYGKQLYLENLYTAQGKNILCDRSVLDTFLYYNYFNKEQFCIYPSLGDSGVGDESGLVAGYTGDSSRPLVYAMDQAFFHTAYKYNKIYLIEPSDREIEDDGFRLIDKKQQQEIHQLFLEYFKDFNNVEIINQEEAHKEEFINKVVSEFVI